MTPMKKIAATAFMLLLGANIFFVKGLVASIEESMKAQIESRAETRSMAKEISEMKESVRGVQDLRVDVAVLKFAVQQMQGTVNDLKTKKTKESQ